MAGTRQAYLHQPSPDVIHRCISWQAHEGPFPARGSNTALHTETSVWLMQEAYFRVADPE